MKKIPTFLLRILDANFNRAKEGLRVCEDILRFSLNDEGLTQEYKKMRHSLNAIFQIGSLNHLLKSRDITADIGKKTTPEESYRKDLASVFFANSQRVKESLRVLEECSKLINIKTSQQFKKIRYSVYDLEKKAINKV